MRLRVVDARWSIGLLLLIVLNINLTVWVRTVNDSSREFDLHPTHNNLGVQIASTRPYEEVVELPNFAIDYSEYLLGAMIERVAESYDLFATMFFICHKLLEVKERGSAQSGISISSEVHDVWKLAMKEFTTTEYAVNGIRTKPPIFYCNISHNGEGGSYYVVEGEFVPDANANNRIDILRCKMSDTERAYMEYANTNTSAQLQVEIIKGNYSLMKFLIPWRSRKTGFMLSEPEGQVVSTFDPWRGFNRDTPGVWKLDNMYMCVPGWEDVPSKASLPLFLEFFEHHLQLGVDHIFTGALFGWESRHMRNARNVMRTYIEEGSVSITSHTSDGIDSIYRYYRS